MIAPHEYVRKYGAEERLLSVQMATRQRARKQLQAGNLTSPRLRPLPYIALGLAALENHGYNGGMGLGAPSETTC